MAQGAEYFKQRRLPTSHRWTDHGEHRRYVPAGHEIGVQNPQRYRHECPDRENDKPRDEVMQCTEEVGAVDGCGPRLILRE